LLKIGERPRTQIRKDENVVLLLAFLVVLLLFGLGFAVHLLWIAAVVFFVLWLVGFALGRGESAGSHRFYRW
jgi:type IV secretory pathway TrbD component